LTRRRPGKGWTRGHMLGRGRIRTDDKGVNNGYLNVFYAQVTSSVRRRRQAQRNPRDDRSQRPMASNTVVVVVVVVVVMAHCWPLTALRCYSRRFRRQPDETHADFEEPERVSLFSPGVLEGNLLSSKMVALLGGRIMC
jgi:hypothetical protein